MLRLTALALTLVSPALLAGPPLQAVGSGCSRAGGEGVVASSFVGMGLQSSIANRSGVRAANGLPGVLIATPVIGDTEAFVRDFLLGLVRPRQLSLHLRGEMDRNADGAVTVADLVRVVNED